jgi:hypothetical protein
MAKLGGPRVDTRFHSVYVVNNLNFSSLGSEVSRWRKICREISDDQKFCHLATKPKCNNFHFRWIALTTPITNGVRVKHQSQSKTERHKNHHIAHTLDWESKDRWRAKVIDHVKHGYISIVHVDMLHLAVGKRYSDSLTTRHKGWSVSSHNQAGHF